MAAEGLPQKSCHNDRIQLLHCRTREWLLRSLGVETTATALVVRLDPVVEPGTPVRARWSTAGHPPPVLVDDDGTTTLLDAHESDLLLAVYDNRDYFGYPVRDFMITRLEKIDPGASISSLLPVFRGDHVAIIADDSKFYGLITQVDLIDHLRTSMQAK